MRCQSVTLLLLFHVLYVAEFEIHCLQTRRLYALHLLARCVCTFVICLMGNEGLQGW